MAQLVLTSQRLLDSSVLALPLGLVGREIGLGCVLGTCFSGWVCLVFAPALVWKFGWSFPGVLLISLSLVGVWCAAFRTNVSPFP